MSTNILDDRHVRSNLVLRRQVNGTASLVPALVIERRRMYAARLAQVQAAPIRNSTRTNEAHYSGLELAEPAVRAGADDHMRLPSRRGDSLYYRGGLVVDVDLSL